jgi:hypothetical protein
VEPEERPIGVCVPQPTCSSDGLICLQYCCVMVGGKATCTYAP